MKALKIFSVFIALQLLCWGAAHVYFSRNPHEALVVVDTSFAMKEKFPAVRSWLKDYQQQVRYTSIRIGTDKADLGTLDGLKSHDVLFRTVFGKISEDSLKRFEHTDASTRILLSDGSLQPPGWQVEVF